MSGPVSKPMLFSGPMVRALLEGRKTQTRRTVKPQPIGYSLEICEKAYGWSCDSNGSISGLTAGDQNYESLSFRTPHPVGSEMWVRETWRTGSKLDDSSPSVIAKRAVEAGFQPGCPVRYEADGFETVWGDNDRHDFGPWGKTRVSIHMPRWASRLTLTVKDVRVERLQDISEEDANAEGVIPGERSPSLLPHQRAYRTLWNEINGLGSWDANPWVFAYTFEVRR